MLDYLFSQAIRKYSLIRRKRRQCLHCKSAARSRWFPRSVIAAVAYQGRIACFELGSGSQAWARDMSSAVGMTIDGRYVYVTDDKGAVHALDLASGASLWKQDKLLMRNVTAPVVRRGLVVVADTEGVVHFLSRDDGSFVARLTTDGSPVTAPPQGLGSNVLIQTNKGGVFAIEAQ